MLLTITCTGEQADDLGYLLHKNPASLWEKNLAFGTARLFYSEAETEKCTAVLQVTVDPVGLVRGNRGWGNNAPATLAQYVSDRPYVPSSFLSVALAEAFGTAMGGRSKERPERVGEKLPLSVHLPVLDCDGGPSAIRGVFEPLGYEVTVSLPAWLDERFPEWGKSTLYAVTLAGNQTVQDALTHLYVLLPVLDNAKHYAFGVDEVEKLLAKGASWLPAHPQKEWITRRYLRYRRPLLDAALARLVDVEGATFGDDAIDETVEAASETPAAPEAQASQATVATQASDAPQARLNDKRIEATIAAVRSCDPPARRVLDMGCGEGKTLASLHRELPQLFLAGMDVSSVVSERAARRLHFDRMGERERERLTLFLGSLVYRDARLENFDCALLNEVIEHIEPARLPTVEKVIFAHARPRRVVVTTPNADYNSVWESLPAGKFRHADHRFEWTRGQFEAWASAVAQSHGYKVAFSGVGDEDAQGRGTPTQMAIFDVI